MSLPERQDTALESAAKHNQEQPTDLSAFEAIKPKVYPPAATSALELSLGKEGPELQHRQMQLDPFQKLCLQNNKYLVQHKGQAVGEEGQILAIRVKAPLPKNNDFKKAKSIIIEEDGNEHECVAQNLIKGPSVFQTNNQSCAEEQPIPFQQQTDIKESEPVQNAKHNKQEDSFQISMELKQEKVEQTASSEPSSPVHPLSLSSPALSNQLNSAPADPDEPVPV